MSDGTSSAGGKTATESLLQHAFESAHARRITLNGAYLDDEKLPEKERVAVLDEVFHRNIRMRQIERLARLLSPLLGGQLPQNLLAYGPSGTGKSVTCLHVLSTLGAMCESQGLPFQHVYVDLTTPHTCFGALNELAIALDGATRRYRKGLALEYMQELIVARLSEREGVLGILIDEADNITVDADLFLTFLAKTLPKRVPIRLFYIFLTNRVEWERTLDPRILSVLKKTDVIFEPYDAVDLIEILMLRVQKALDPRKVDDAAVNKIAALASRETGDARKAVELLAKAVKVAEETTGHLTEGEVDRAQQALEVDKTEALIATLARQQRLALEACYRGFTTQQRRLTTGDAYAAYCDVCLSEGNQPLTQRRFSEMINFLDIYGLVHARVVSKGRYGKTRELSGTLPKKVVARLFEER